MLWMKPAKIRSNVCRRRILKPCWLLKTWKLTGVRMCPGERCPPSWLTNALFGIEMIHTPWIAQMRRDVVREKRRNMADWVIRRGPWRNTVNQISRWRNQNQNRSFQTNELNSKSKQISGFKVDATIRQDTCRVWDWNYSNVRLETQLGGKWWMSGTPMQCCFHTKKSQTERGGRLKPFRRAGKCAVACFPRMEGVFLASPPERVQLKMWERCATIGITEWEWHETNAW